MARKQTVEYHLIDLAAGCIKERFVTRRSALKCARELALPAWDIIEVPLVEYQLICFFSGESHGGFCSAAGARDYAFGEGLPAWQIYCGDTLVELHNPFDPPEPRLLVPPPAMLPEVKHLRKRKPEALLSMAAEAFALAEVRTDARTRRLMEDTARLYVTLAHATELIQDSKRRLES